MFLSEKKVAIVWFAKSSLQLAFTVDDNKNEYSSLNPKNKNDNENTIFPLKMKQFQPLNENQHFIFHTILPTNYFHDAFFRIESISRPGYFLDAFDDNTKEETNITVFLSHGSQNTKKWQFINGQFRCNNGKSIIIFDSNGIYSLKIIKTLTTDNDNENNDKNGSSDSDKERHILSQTTELYEESIFNLCFYDGNSIPEQTPIVFYSPLFNKVINLITNSDLNSGGHWLRMMKFDAHSPSQVWIFNKSHQNDIRSSTNLNQAFDYYNDGHRYLLYTHFHHGRPNQQWDYVNYKLITREQDRLTVEYDENLKEFKMRKDINRITDQREEENENNNNDIKNLSEVDIFGQPNTFLVFLAFQNNLANFSADLDNAYLYNFLNNQFFLQQPDVEYDKRSNDEIKLKWYSFDEFRGNIKDTYQETYEYEKDCDIISFKDNPDKKIKFRNVTSLLNERYSYSNDSTISDVRDIKNWKIFNHYVNGKISISSDQRIFIHNVQLSDFSSITFSLIMKGELLSNYQKKGPSTDENSKYVRGGNYTDSFDIPYDNESTFGSQNGNNANFAHMNIRHRPRGLRPFFGFVRNNDPPESTTNLNNDWQPSKPYYPDYLKDLKAKKDDNNNNNNNRNNNHRRRLFLPGRVLQDPNTDNDNDNNNDNDEDNKDQSSPKLTYFSMKDVPSNIDDQFRQLLNGEPITINKDNSEYCRFLGSQLGISGMIEIANFVDSFSLQYARLSELSEIQKELMTINSSNYQTLSNEFSTYAIKYDYSTICWIILSVAITKPLENDSLAKFCQNLIHDQPPEFKEEFKKAIILDFKSSKPNMFFYRKVYLYCDLFTPDEMRKLLQLRIKRQADILYFFKEFPDLIAKDLSGMPQFDCKLKNKDEIYEFNETGFKSNQLLKIIRDDDVDSFQSIFIAQRIDPNKPFKIEGPERIQLLSRNMTLIQYAAFFGSLKIFKFLLLQKAKVEICDDFNRTAFTYAIAGGNTEMIHIIHQELNKNKEFSITTDMMRNAIKFGQNDVFQWLFSNQNKERIKIRDLILEAILSKNISALLDLVEYIYTCESICVHFSTIFNNCEFLKLLYPFYFENKFSLVCDAAISGNVEILQYLLESNRNDFTEKINLDKSLKKVAIRTAIRNNNAEVFKYLASEEDYSNSNFIYACKCDSLYIIELFISQENSNSFLSSFDFSNILINNISLTVDLINSRKQAVLNILVDSKSFDFGEKYNGHSLFYHAVSNEMFNFARKLYKNFNKLYDINEEGLLLKNVENPRIVQFLISFPELNVNATDANLHTAIDLLFREEKKDESVATSVLYLLERPEIQFEPFSLLKFALETQNDNVFNKVLQVLVDQKDKINEQSIADNSQKLIDIILKYKLYDFFIDFYKSGLISIDKEKLIVICNQMSSPKVYHEIYNDQIPADKVLIAVLYSIYNDDESCFSYILSVIPHDISYFNDYIFGNDETVLTYAVKNTKKDSIIQPLLNNKSIDVNKPNKSGESPFYIVLKNNYQSLIELFLIHNDIKFTYKEFEYALTNKKEEVVKFILNHIDKFVDDQQEAIQLIFKNKSTNYLTPIIDENVNNANFALFKSKSLLSTILINCIKLNMKNLYEAVLNVNHNEINLNVEDPENKGATALCYAIYQRKAYFFEKLKNYHPLLLAKDFNSFEIKENQITSFGNVRSVEMANELIKMLLHKNVPTELIIHEVCGLNIYGQTSLYTSIEENNYVLFQYLLDLNDDLNRRIKEEGKEQLVDALIYAKNKDGKNPFFASCMNKNWQLFVNPLLNKLHQLNNNEYFGRFNPLSASLLAKNFKLVEILLSKGFIVEHYSFCQLLKMDLWNSLGKRLLEANKDFQLDLFMPLHLIKDDKVVEKLFLDKRINYNFQIDAKNRSYDEIEDYLLVSAIKNRNDSLTQLIFQNCGENYDNLFFDWKDIHGKTALHYAIEKSTTNIIYKLIDIFTIPSSNAELVIETEKRKENDEEEELINCKNGRFSLFFINDENNEAPIHYLLKSMNEDYILYFYKHALSCLKSINKEEYIKKIFNLPILNYVEKRYLPSLLDRIRSVLDQEDINNFEEEEEEKDENKNIIESISYKQLSDVDIALNGIFKNSIENIKRFIYEPKGDLYSKETVLTFSIRNNKVKFLKFLLENITEVDPNAENNHGMTPLQVSRSNPVLFETLIELCCQKVPTSNNLNQKNVRNDLDVNKKGIAFSILNMKDPKKITFCLNLLMQCENFDFNQKITLNETKKHKEKKEILLLDKFLSKINLIDDETQKTFLTNPKVNFNLIPDIVFKLIVSPISNSINYSSLFEKINDDIMQNARTDDADKETVATFIAQNYSHYQALMALIIDPRVDFINAKNAKGKSAIDILNAKGQTEILKIILALKKQK